MCKGKKSVNDVAHAHELTMDGKIYLMKSSYKNESIMYVLLSWWC